MIFRETRVSGAFEVVPTPHQDERGSFARTFCEREFAERGLANRFHQCNLSRNPHRGTLRGLHLQRPPHAEVKLVRCVAGAIFDVALDLRIGSPAFRSWVGVELSAERGNALYIPAGCAHGFVTLRPDSDVFYHMGGFYTPESAHGFRWNDPAFGIDWPLAPLVISERDRSYPDFDPSRPGG